MPKIPFSVYDFFGYLASGFLLMATVIYIGTKKCLFCYELNFVTSVFLILIAYTIGHLVAIPAKLLYERWIVMEWLTPPSEVLFKQKSEFGFRAKLFFEYYDPFPKEIADKIEAIAIEDGVWKEKKDALFHYAYAKAKANSESLARQDLFLSLYGFCRNLSFGFLLVAFFIFLGGWNRGFLLNLVLIYASVLALLGLFYKYTKFFRQYSYELFLSYLETPRDKEKSDQDKEKSDQRKKKGNRK